GIAPGSSGSQPETLTLELRPQLLPVLWKSDPPAGAAPASSALRVRCIADLCHGGIEMVLPRGLAPRASAFAGRRAELLHFGSLEKRAPCRCRPRPPGLEDRRARCYTNDAFESGG